VQNQKLSPAGSVSVRYSNDGLRGWEEPLGWGVHSVCDPGMRVSKNRAGGGAGGMFGLQNQKPSAAGSALVRY
jgi:hypothetical protein